MEDNADISHDMDEAVHEPQQVTLGDHAVRNYALECRKAFERILTIAASDRKVVDRLPQLSKQAHGQKPILTLADLRDELEHFQVWAQNIGTFASDHASLDYRVRDAPEVKSSIVALLRSLFSSLDQRICVINQTDRI